MIGLCETRLNNNISSLYKLNHYNGFYQNKSTASGGLVIYVHESFQATVRSIMSLQLSHIESLFLVVTGPEKFSVILTYRPPNSDLSDFNSTMENILESITHTNIPCYIMGNTNINLLNRNSKMFDFTHLLYSYLFFPTITKPTRINRTSASIIDHIWTNNMKNYVGSGIIYTQISDHFPIFSVFFSENNLATRQYITVKNRVINNENILKFKAELEQYRWEEDVTDNVNSSFDMYINKFKALYNKKIPVKEYRIKKEHGNKPYITAGIKKSIKHRNKLQKLSAKWPLTYEKSFKQFRNTLTAVIRAGKNDYYKTTLEDRNRDQKKIWMVVNEISR